MLRYRSTRALKLAVIQERRIKQKLIIEISNRTIKRKAAMTDPFQSLKTGNIFQPKRKEEKAVAQRKSAGEEQYQEIKERAKKKLASGNFDQLSEDEIKYLTKNIMLTTETTLTDIPIQERLEIITAECVYGMNVFRDFFASMTDFFGGRSKASQKVLRDARKVCLFELKREALMVGANAVIAVDLDYNEISGGGRSGMLLLIASGTAVKIKKINSELEQDN